MKGGLDQSYKEYPHLKQRSKHEQVRSMSALTGRLLYGKKQLFGCKLVAQIYVFFVVY